MRNFTSFMIAGLFFLMSDEIAAQYVSPEVHDDGSVTFRLRAPQATEVKVVGIHGQPDLTMEQTDGMWLVTTEPLPAELYSYSFEVDGTKILDPSNRNVKKWLTCASLVAVPGDPPELWELTDVPHGVTHHHVYDSKAAGSQRGVYVYTPPRYSANKTREYRVLILLHGYGDDESAWLEVGRAHRIADNLIAKDLIEPTVIVMPYGHPLPLDLRESFDDYADRNVKLMQKDIVEDLIPYLQQHYRLLPRRDDWAIAGLSMGGGQALTIGLNHLDRFAHVGGFSSAAPRGSDEEIDALLSPLSQDVSAANGKLASLWIACGRDDFLLDRNHRFVDWLKERGVKHDYVLTEGGHDWIVWRDYLPRFLEECFGVEPRAR